MTIARAPIGNLTAGPTPGTPNGSVLINEATRGGGNAQNPALIPMESENIDLSLEWYFSDSGYVSVGYFDKKVDNFVGNSIVQQNLYGLTDPTAGPDAQAALAFLQANSQVINDTTLFAATALQRVSTLNMANFTAAMGNVAGTEALYDIAGIRRRDPLYQFNVNQSINQEDGLDRRLGNRRSVLLRRKRLRRAGELHHGQRRRGLRRHCADDREPVRLAGPERHGQLGADVREVRLLGPTGVQLARRVPLGANLGNSRNPRFVEEYEQFDLSVGYDFNDHLSVTFEAINLTGEDIRWHGRSELQVFRLEDQFARYAIGARYKF